MGTWTHDFDVVLCEVIALVYCAMLALADGSAAQIIVENETSGLVVVCPALMYGVCYAHVCGGIKGKAGVHDLETGRVHVRGSMKGR